MYYQVITTVAYFFSAIFIILLVRTYSKNSVRQTWHQAKEKVKTNLRIKSHVEKALARGEKEFLFRNETVSIFAKTQARALFKYKQLQNQEKEKEKLSLDIIANKRNYSRFLNRIKKAS